MDRRDLPHLPPQQPAAAHHSPSYSPSRQQLHMDRANPYSPASSPSRQMSGSSPLRNESGPSVNLHGSSAGQQGSQRYMNTLNSPTRSPRRFPQPSSPTRPSPIRNSPGYGTAGAGSYSHAGSPSAGNPGRFTPGPAPQRFPQQMAGSPQRFGAGPSPQRFGPQAGGSPHFGEQQGLPQMMHPGQTRQAEPTSAFPRPNENASTLPRPPSTAPGANTEWSRVESPMSSQLGQSMPTINSQIGMDKAIPIILESSSEGETEETEESEDEEDTLRRSGGATLPPIPPQPSFSQTTLRAMPQPTRAGYPASDDDHETMSISVEDSESEEDEHLRRSGNSHRGGLPPPPNYSGDDYVSDENDGTSGSDSDDSDGGSEASEDTLSAEELLSAPAKQPRRNKLTSRKEVKLVRGNLVLDCPVPTKLYSFLPRRDNDEFVYMRYTACTASADEYADAGFNLRQSIYERETELCICITMYNEDEVLFTRTLHAVMKNIAHLCSRNRSRVWGKEGWKKVVVLIVSDGRAKIHPRVLDALAAMGVYQDGIAKNYVNGSEVKSHIFEYTTQVSLDPDLKFQGAEKGIMPVQMIFCLKEKNAKKINSHRWLFKAFCPLLDPNVCILLDVGTKPGTDSLYHLWKAFDSDSNVAGACGEIKPMIGKMGHLLLNPLVAAQNFEYKMSNILDKPLESVFGYISVLPGALSAYRYRALQDNEDGTGPLSSYFKGETLHGGDADADIFTKNMYLAEDRILCWELVAKKGEKWVLKYVKAATGETDVPERVPEFLSQRRRWLNGALFAAIFSLTHWRKIWDTDHSFLRKFLLMFEFCYMTIQLVFTFFSLANFYLTFYFVAGSLSEGNKGAIIPHNGGLILFLIFKYICVCSLAAQFVLSLGNRPQGSEQMFTVSIALLSAVQAYSLFAGFFFVIRSVEVDGGAILGDNNFTNIVISMASTYGVYLLNSLLYFEPWHLVTSFAQYFLLMPAYSCTLQIYAFCNTHDVSWGTKGDNVAPQDLGAAVIKSAAGKDIVEIDIPSEQLDIDAGYEEALCGLREHRPAVSTPPSADTIRDDYYKEVRTRVVLVWLICNCLLAMIMIQVFPLSNTQNNTYLKIILWSVAGMSVFRCLGSLVYLVQLCVKYLSESKNKTFSRRDPLTGQKAQ